jgi:hypothetical protein
MERSILVKKAAMSAFIILSAINLTFTSKNDAPITDKFITLKVSTTQNSAYAARKAWIWTTCGGVDNLCPYSIIGCGPCDASGYAAPNGICRWVCYCNIVDGAWSGGEGDCHISTIY